MTKKIFLFIILLSSITYAATLEGTIYDLELDQAKDIVVEINTEPHQRLISKDGTYSFNIPVGEYVIEAKKIEHSTLLSSTKESITIKDENTYNLDLFLYPNLEDETSLLEENDIEITDIFDEGKNINSTLLVWLIVLILLVILFFIYKPRKKEKEKGLDEDLQKVLEIIKKQGNRTTQKEIRKSLGLSEAKVSLMITELESLGKIKRIKKGRGNVIILRP